MGRISERVKDLGMRTGAELSYSMPIGEYVTRFICTQSTSGDLTSCMERSMLLLRKSMVSLRDLSPLLAFQLRKAYKNWS